VTHALKWWPVIALSGTLKRTKHPFQQLPGSFFWGQRQREADLGGGGRGQPGLILPPVGLKGVDPGAVM
jgi:hypothetical protein